MDATSRKVSVDVTFDDLLFNAPLDGPYQMLLLSMLQCAIDDLGKNGQLHERAYRWIFNKQSDEVMSINWVCQALGIHPDHLRRHLNST